jgi:hypothetical protein
MLEEEVSCNRTGALGILKNKHFWDPMSLRVVGHGGGTYYGKTLLFERICSFQNPANGESAMHNLRPYGKCGFGGT